MRSASWLAFLNAVIISISLTTTAPSALAQPPALKIDPAFAEIVDDPTLPRVLLIGDSISIGYTPEVRKLLVGKANVHRIPVNGGPTILGLKKLDQWLGDEPWGLIHFNWGLHDLRRDGAKQGASTKGDDPRQVPPDEYEANLRKLVARLKETGAKLIWCTTTPVPNGAAKRVPGDEVTYNEIAERVMRDEQIEINDLYAFAKPQLEEIQRPADVHYTRAGSRTLAKQVASSIEATLKE